jgi:acyl-CoA synthetase (AMP-forming)/AMP-acid ligase II
VMTVGGEAVSSLAVEAALSEHPCVQEVAVVGLPDRRLGQVVDAYVVLDDPDLLPHVIAFAAERLRPPRRPALARRGRPPPFGRGGGAQGRHPGRRRDLTGGRRH